jgi:hypothetical protein
MWRRYDVDIQGTRYRRVPTSRYRVWWLEQLRAHYEALAEPQQSAARSLLEKHGGWEPLWRNGPLDSGHDPEGEAPFGAGLEALTFFRRRRRGER